MCKYAVEIKDVHMRFNLATEKVDNLKEYVVNLFKGKAFFDEFYALKGVSCNIEKGDAFAILGANGSGKSTMLKIISGIYKPTKGTVAVNGSIAPLIEVGAGFDMNLTARENVFLNGAVLGYKKVFMREKLDEIIGFADLWEFIDVPLKNYSSGMIARLGFSIATIVKPDILIVDEILAVGDAVFQSKCEQKMAQMMSDGVTLILVSHSIDQVKKVCKHAICLSHGSIVLEGEVNEICDAYSQMEV